MNKMAYILGQKTAEDNLANIIRGLANSGKLMTGKIFKQAPTGVKELLYGLGEHPSSIRGSTIMSSGVKKVLPLALLLSGIGGLGIHAYNQHKQQTPSLQEILPK